MRKTISIASHVAIVLFVAATAVYGVYRFIEEVKRPEKSFLDVLAIVLFVAYIAAIMRVDFEMFINAGSLAYGVGRSKPSRVVTGIIVLACGLFFVLPPVVALVYRVFTGTDIMFGWWLPFALLGDLVIYVIFRWIRFLSSVSEEK